MNWTFFNQTFEYKTHLSDYHEAWTGHAYFAYDLVRNLKPKLIVELGTYKGTSLFSFAQAVKDSALKTEIHAIDAWEGDVHMGFYGSEIYHSVVDIVHRNYGQQQIRLCKKYFDEAVKDFPNHSIDILHIDGTHTYEAVKNDYENWKNKVKLEGVILFHDILVADFGVWKLWKEIKEEHPNYQYIDFKHNYGLGVLFKSQEIKEKIDFENIDLFILNYENRAAAHLIKEEMSFVRTELQALKAKQVTKSNFAQLFYNIGQDFNEIDSIKFNIQEGKNQCAFDLSKIKNIQSFRLDPINLNSKIKLNSVKIVTENEQVFDLKLNYSNHNTKEEGKYIYYHHDPIFFFDIPDVENQKIIRLIADFEWEEISDSEKCAYLSKLEKECQELEAELCLKEQKIDRLYNSKIWKLTQPLRGIASFLSNKS